MEWCEQFKEECKANPDRFDKPIKRRKVKNSSHDAVKMKVKSKDLKVRRDLFGRMLFVAVTQ